MFNWSDYGEIRLQLRRFEFEFEGSEEATFVVCRVQELKASSAFLAPVQRRGVISFLSVHFFALLCATEREASTLSLN